MADLLNLQINGTPIVMYGLIGVTTAVLAYATAGGEFGNFASKTMGALSPDALIGDVSAPSEGLGNLNPFDSKTAESSGTEEATEEPEKEAPENEEPANEAPTEESNTESGEETKGGKKKRNRKTPKKRKPNKRGKTKKRKTNKSKR
jgi:hypothetical protein